jgi:gliding motility-associated-like protein
VVLPAPNLGVDSTICEAQIYTLNVRHPFSQYVWNTGATTPELRVTKAGLYTVAVSNACGMVYDSVTINQQNCNCYVWVPNVFTPNGDQTNDYFSPRLSCEYDYFNLVIYNRWGQEVFSSNKISVNWDGKANGIELPSDVYIWKITSTLRNAGAISMSKNVSGTVTLLR